MLLQQWVHGRVAMSPKTRTVSSFRGVCSHIGKFDRGSCPGFAEEKYGNPSPWPTSGVTNLFLVVLENEKPKQKALLEQAT